MNDVLIQNDLNFNAIDIEFRFFNIWNAIIKTYIC